MARHGCWVQTILHTRIERAVENAIRFGRGQGACVLMAQLTFRGIVHPAVGISHQKLLSTPFRRSFREYQSRDIDVVLSPQRQHECLERIEFRGRRQPEILALDTL